MRRGGELGRPRRELAAAGDAELLARHEHAGRLAARFADLAGVRVLESPLPRNKHLLSLYRDAIETNDPGHRWFRDALRRAAAAEADIPHRS